MKMKKITVLLILSIASIFSGFAQFFNSPEVQKLGIITYAIQNFYVDSVKEKELVENAIIGMLEKLDPHSVYIPKDEVKKMNEPLEGSFEGIGVQFQMMEDTLLVVQTISGGPSERVGIMAGDRIIFVNDTTIAGVKMQNTDIQKRLRGPKGTVVRVKVLRRGVKDLIDFKIVRDKIPIYSLDASYMVSPEIGYIKLNRFSATTMDEYHEAFNKLKKKGMKSLILDLQGNGGGYLNAAVDLADEFLEKGRMIVYTEGNAQPRQMEIATSRGNFEKGNLVILIDEGSASASEIVAGAIQDWDRGVLVGRRTFGKGLVQKAFPLPDESQIRLTVARYYTPVGRNIQRPYDSGIGQYKRDLIERYNHGELQHADSIAFPDSLKFTTKISGRTVFGGGGIMPDIFIPIDTARITDYHRDLVASGAMNKFALNYVENNRKELTKIYNPKKEGSFENFKANFQVTNDLLQKLIDAGTQEKVEYNEEQFLQSKALISLQLKAIIASDLWRMNEYHQIMNQANDSYLKAIEILQDQELYNRILGKK
jgi:carboxyl-terminal processing protease